ncbi:MAG: GntR family transcriptional regulator [Actinomycetota bacterium]
MASAQGDIGSGHRPLRELVADEIRSMILRGDLGPGDRLQEVALAAELGVSRNPVREAIRALEVIGLVDVVPRVGASVASFDREDLGHLLEIRAAVESLAAELAAGRRDADDLVEIDRCLSEGRGASEAGDLTTAADWHHRFHRTVERASRNPQLATTLTPLRQRTEVVFSMLGSSRQVVSWEQHQRIRDAIADGNVEAAGLATRAHLRSVAEALIAGAGPGRPPADDTA